MVTGKAWTHDEVSLICATYAAMLRLELEGKKFVKAKVRRDTLPKLDGRSEGSYEMKCCNISAACIDAGLPWIKGYKPLKGYQRSLKDAITIACDLFGIKA